MNVRRLLTLRIQNRFEPSAAHASGDRRAYELRVRLRYVMGRNVKSQCGELTYEIHPRLIPAAQRRCRSPPYLQQKNRVRGHSVELL